MSEVDLDVPVDRVVADRYRLLDPIGSGASAEVFEATDVRLGRKVAVKVLHPGLASDTRFVDRFRHEAQLAASLSHPNLLAVYDWGNDDGVYIVVELMAGGSLAEIITADDLLSPSQALAVGLEAARGLAYAHSKGLVHRDIKPANLLFGQDTGPKGRPTHRLRVADFGIARAVAEAAWTEPEGVLIGTARYAAPEQAIGGTVTGAADVYSLALSIIEAITGDVPLVADSALGTMVRRQEDPIPVPEAVGPMIDVLSDAGRVDPQTRPTAEEFAARLMQAAKDLPRPEPLPISSGARPLKRAAARVHAATDQGATPLLDVTRSEPVLAPDGNTDGPLAAPAADPHAEAGPVQDTTPPADRSESGRGVLVFGLFAMVLLIAAGAWVAIRWQGSPSVFAGPPVGSAVGLPWPADSTPLVVPVADAFDVHSDSQPVGTVVSQLPPSWWPAERVGGVVLFVSIGPATVAVPTVVGLEQSAAASLLVDSGLEPGETSTVFDETVPVGFVVRSEPATGDVIDTGSTVDLVLSDGPAPRVVPALFDLTLEEATALLEGDGLVVGEITEDYSDDVASGSIIGASADAGDELAKGSTVDLVVSKGPQFFEIPNVAGQDPDDATDDLQDAGFVVVGVIGPPNEPVTRTDPAAGEFHAKGREITIHTR